VAVDVSSQENISPNAEYVSMLSKRYFHFKEEGIAEEKKGFLVGKSMCDIYE
jgi:hypothetical protein